jgi:hypothetical protein
MRKSVFVLAVIGAACSSVAFAAEATTMSDAQMDKVTAGDAGGQGKGQGNAFGFGQNPGPGWMSNNSPHAGPK